MLYVGIMYAVHYVYEIKQIMVYIKTFLPHFYFIVDNLKEDLLILKYCSRSAWLAQSVEHATLDLGVMSSSAALGIVAYFKRDYSGTRGWLSGLSV